jgi:hypothetical protein
VPADADAGARTLHARLIEPLKLPPSVRLYIAPDDVLHLLPFPRLLDAQGRRLAEQLDIRLVQTSRDLLRPSATAPAQGLLALGGIDFGKAPAQLAELEPSVFAARGSPTDLRAATAESFRQGFRRLKHSGPEVTTIGQLYRQARPAEPAEVWTASEAGEARLKQLTRPPRVLHLATHGFYRPARDQADRPMLLAGITLAGANLALRQGRPGRHPLRHRGTGPEPRRHRTRRALRLRDRPRGDPERRWRLWLGAGAAHSGAKLGTLEQRIRDAGFTGELADITEGLERPLPVCWVEQRWRSGRRLVRRGSRSESA